jgi:hypothetical protein
MSYVANVLYLLPYFPLYLPLSAFLIMREE